MSRARASFRSALAAFATVPPPDVSEPADRFAPRAAGS
jgi:hypothetical protein